MAQFSVWHVKFHLEAQLAGKMTSGPYNAFIGLSGGKRNDIQMPSVVSSLASAISNNLLGILQGMGFAGSAAPGGTVVIDDHSHGSVPDIWT
jgi:hypothetical protein